MNRNFKKGFVLFCTLFLLIGCKEETSKEPVKEETKTLFCSMNIKEDAIDGLETISQVESVFDKEGTTLMSMQNKLIMDTKDVDFELMNRTISSFAKTFSDNYCASFQEDSCSLEISESMITITVHRKLENIPLKSYEEVKQFYEEEGYTCTK